MDMSWENDSCEVVRLHYALYSVLEASALWCGVAEADFEEVVKHASKKSEKGMEQNVWIHSYIPCIEPRSLAIADAMETGELPYGREDGKPIKEGDHAAHQRRRFFGKDLKKWIEITFPTDQPKFLFSELERSVNSGISTEDYLTLKARNDALEERVQKAKQWFKEHKPVATQGHNAYRDVITTLTEIIIERELSGSPASDAKALIQAVESKGKVLPTEKTLSIYLTPK